MSAKASSRSTQSREDIPEQPPTQLLKDSIGFLLNRAGVAMGNAFSQELKMSGLTLAMWRVLAALHDNDHQSLSGLSDIISVEISTLSRQISTLAGRGLVISQPSGKNWRSVDISLTPAGFVVVQRIRPATNRHERAALDGTDPADIKLLKQLLGKIYVNLCTLDKVLPVMVDADNSTASQTRTSSNQGAGMVSGVEKDQ